MEPRLPAALAVSSLVLLPSGSDTVRRATMHRARAPGWAPCGDHWRRGRDSNPRWSYPHTRFPSVLLRPLGHLSSRFFSHGGEEGIRTLGPREGSTVFETAPIDHSGTSPHGDRHSTLFVVFWQRRLQGGRDRPQPPTRLGWQPVVRGCDPRPDRSPIRMRRP